MDIKISSKCVKCGGELKHIVDKDLKDFGGYAFDCCECGEEYAVPRNNPKLIITESKILEFKIEGCIYSEKEVTLDELQEAFLDFCDSKGWEHCGMIKPLEIFKEENNKNE